MELFPALPNWAKSEHLSFQLERLPLPLNMIATVTLDDFVEEIPHSQVFPIISSYQNYLKYDLLFLGIEYFDVIAILLFSATSQMNQDKF